MGAKEPMHQEELAAAALGKTHRLRVASPVESVQPQAFKDTDRGVDRRMRGAIAPPTVPATVGHLLLQQVFGKSIETFIVILEVRQDGEHHAGNACLAPTPPFSPDAVVDPAVLLEPSVKEETAGLPCLPVARQQAKVTE